MKKTLDEILVHYTEEDLLRKYQKKLDDAVFAMTVLKLALFFTKNKKEKKERCRNTISILMEGISALQHGRLPFVIYLEDKISDESTDGMFYSIFEIEKDGIKRLDLAG